MGKNCGAKPSGFVVAARDSRPLSRPKAVAGVDGTRDSRPLSRASAFGAFGSDGGVSGVRVELEL